MERIFKVHGRVVDGGGAPVPGALVALVDEDTLSADDLLGVGVTGEDGVFRLSFTTAAFNQEILEREVTPDLYVVCSTRSGPSAPWVPCLRRDFPALRYRDEEDLGDLVLTLGRPPLAGLSPWPGATKYARRVVLDRDMIDLALREVAPMVEALTGWKHLLEGVTVRVVDGLGEAQIEASWATNGIPARPDGGVILGFALRALKAAVSQVASRQRRIEGIAALYEPSLHTIFLDRPSLEPQGLDGLKVMLGHELVHVGQFREHPELADEFHALRRVVYAPRPSASDPSDEEAARRAEAAVASASRALIAFSTNIEGHAMHIESDFLRHVYNCADPLPHRALVDAFLFDLATAGHAADPTTSPHAGPRADADDPYTRGLAMYRARRVGANPAPFDPALRPELASPASPSARSS